jgi:hypothetical protein
VCIGCWRLRVHRMLASPCPSCCGRGHYLTSHGQQVRCLRCGRFRPTLRRGLQCAPRARTQPSLRLMVSLPSKFFANMLQFEFDFVRWLNVEFVNILACYWCTSVAIVANWHEVSKSAHLMCVRGEEGPTKSLWWPHGANPYSCAFAMCVCV